MGDYLVSHPFLRRFVTSERSRVSVVNHCSDVEDVLRCLRITQPAEVDEQCTWLLELPSEVLHHCLVEEGDQSEAEE